MDSCPWPSRGRRTVVDRDIVKDVFGHTSFLTVDNYFQSFEDDQYAELAQSAKSISGIKKQIEKTKQKGMVTI